MNIIFGRENAEVLEEKYTILELDTFKIGEVEVAAYCAVEEIPIFDMPKLSNMKSLHANLLENFRKGDWNYCEQALEHLVGFWNHDLDTFYDSIRDRIAQHKDTELSDKWWVIVKNSA